MKTVSEKLCSFNAQGEIVCVQHSVDYTSVDTFKKQGAEMIQAERAERASLSVVTDEDQKWTGINTEVVTSPGASAIVSPPNDAYNMDWKRYEKPLYPFALEPAWGDNSIGYSSIPLSDTWTSHTPRCTTFMSSQWDALAFDQNEF